MNPQLVFWIPAVLRMSIILLGTGLAWFFWGPTVGLTIGLLIMAALVLVQLHYLYQLANWLDNPDSAKLPDGWGAWTDIFSRLYRLRRDDERNRTELTEWLARFRQAFPAGDRCGHPGRAAPIRRPFGP